MKITKFLNGTAVQKDNDRKKKNGKAEKKVKTEIGKKEENI